MDSLSSTIEGQLKERLKMVVSHTTTLWQRGLYQHPDFTLHGPVHSQTIDRLIQEFAEYISIVPALNNREKFILTSATYLHDIGMLFPLESLVLNQANSDEGLIGHTKGECCEIVVGRFCKEYGYEEHATTFFSELGKKPLPERMKLGEIVRQFHHLFGDFWIREHGERFGLPRQAVSLVARVSKGHRVVNLKDKEYDDTSWSGSTIRIGALTALLRVADELDFSSERAPDILFEMFIDDLIRDPQSLEHWIRHFCIRSVGPIKFATTSEGYIEPTVSIVADIPSDDYQQLVETQLEKSKTQVRTSDVNYRLQSIGLCCPIVESKITVDPTATHLPAPLRQRIGDLKVQDFLRQQMENMVLEEEENLIREGFAHDEISLMVGYKRELYKVEYDCINKRKTKVTWEVHIRATQELSHITHFYGADEAFKYSSDLEFFNLTADRTINATRRFAKANTYREIDILIDPPLAQGDDASYRFTETYDDLFEYSQKVIAEKIATGHWPFPDVVEGPGSVVMVPTDELQLSVTLPKNLEIDKIDFRIQRTNINLLHEPETKRIRRLKCFKTDDSDDRKYTQLIVPNPQLMVEYWILWVTKEK